MKFYFLIITTGVFLFYILYLMKKSKKALGHLKTFEEKIDKPPPQYPPPEDIERTARSYQSFIWDTLAKIRTPDDIDSKQHFLLTLDISKIEIPENVESPSFKMTIVLQWDFEITDIDEEAFSVILRFNNVPEKLTIPYEYIISFADPSADFEIKNPDYS